MVIYGKIEHVLMNYSMQSMLPRETPTIEVVPEFSRFEFVSSTPSLHFSASYSALYSQCFILYGMIALARLLDSPTNHATMR